MPPVLVAHLMTSPVLSLQQEQTIPTASDIMKYMRVHHLPVIDAEQRVVGLVSQRDLLAAHGSDAPVARIMTRGVLAVRSDVHASFAAAALLDHKFGCLPVVDEHGRLVGIVTQHDFLRLATKVLETADGDDQPALSTLTTSSCSTRAVRR
jgi:CBS domain-containing protein